jgi:uncharacterized protein YaiL (DUF2058 family)
MTSSLRDALRQSGVLDQFKPIERPKQPRPGRPGSKGPAAHDGKRHANAAGNARTRDGARGRAPQANAPARRAHDEEIDLAKAYALRAQSEQREREAKERAEREAAERRRRQREQVAALLEGATLNREDAETPRHFEYGGKIRRVYVTDEQLAQVNDGRLGVIQMRGRYLLVERALAETIRGVDAHAVALLVDPEEVAAEVVAGTAAEGTVASA